MKSNLLLSSLQENLRAAEKAKVKLMKFSSIVAALLAASLSSSYAADVAPSMKTLLSGYEKKISMSEQVDAYAEHAQAQNSSAQSWLASDVDLVIHHETDVFSEDVPSRNWQVGAATSIKLPQQKQAQQALAALSAQAPAIEKQYLRWQASAHLRALIWDLKEAQVAYDLDQKALQVSQSWLDKVIAQVKVGERAKLEQMLAEQQVLQQRVRLQESQALLDNRLQAYSKWTGLQKLPESILETQVSGLHDPHPQLLKAKLANEQHRSQVELAKAEKSGTPSLFLGVQQDQLENQKDNSMIFEVSVPLGVNPQASKQLAEQKLILSQSNYAMKKQQDEIELRLVQIANSLLAMRSSLQMNEQKLNLAEESLALSEKSYRLGEINIQTLLQTQRDTIQIRKEYALAKIQLGRLIAEYNQQAGFILGEKK